LNRIFFIIFSLQFDFEFDSRLNSIFKFQDSIIIESILNLEFLNRYRIRIEIFNSFQSIFNNFNIELNILSLI